MTFYIFFERFISKNKFSTRFYVFSILHLNSGFFAQNYPVVKLIS